MSLSAGTTKFASITQNNYVYEETVKRPTPEVSLSVRNLYRRQERIFSINRPSFRRPYLGIEISTVNTHYTTIVLLPTRSTSYLLPNFYYIPTDLLPTYLPTSYLHTHRPPTYIPTDLTTYILIDFSTELPDQSQAEIPLSSFGKSDHVKSFITFYLANQDRA